MKGIKTIALALLVAMMAGCGGDDKLDDALVNYRLDIVTYVGHDASGNAAFDYYGQDNGAPARLLTTWPHDIGARDGQRVLLRYGVPEGRELVGNVPVEAYGVSAIVSDTLRVTNDDAATVGSDAVRLRSVWRTGPYMNVRCQLEFTGDAKRTFGLITQPAAVDADTVVCHLVHNLRGATPQQWRDCYASFWIGDVIVHESCHVLRVVVDHDVVRPNDTTYDFIIRQ